MTESKGTARGKAKDARFVITRPYKSKLQVTAPLSPEMKAAAAMGLLSEGRGPQTIEQRLGSIEVLRKLLV